MLEYLQTKKLNVHPSNIYTMALRTEDLPFVPEALPEKSTWLALTSPYMGMEDFKWFLKQLSPLEEYLALNKQLYNSLIEFNFYDVAIPKDIPVYYISGTHDYVCPVAPIEDYIHANGVNGSLYTLENCGTELAGETELFRLKR